MRIPENSLKISLRRNSQTSLRPNKNDKNPKVIFSDRGLMYSRKKGS